MNEDCAFCQIFSGKQPAHEVYKDSEAMAFLDINPVSRGHVLVIPRQHIGEFYELGSETYATLMNVIQRLARDIKRRLGAQRINIKTVGEHVPDHAHIHLIPVYPDIAANPSANDKDLADLAQILNG